MKLKDYLKETGLKMCWFAEKIDYSGPHISNILSGRYKPGRKFIKRVAEFTSGKVTKEDFD